MIQKILTYQSYYLQCQTAKTNIFFNYTTLDSVLTLLIDQNYSTEDVIKKGYNIQDVNHIVHLIQKSQFKREQASTGLLIN
ncbi:hypothetical protein [Ehrlichia japonica]|uniref:NAD synthase family protein n=1 Tax=Ehrlichia japonica TaxID=391036 RepID=X5GIE7_9RICK|nr:hypothetical protein [Ehrlichia japonica]AHX04218.1 NAD synthase family protein [Ehrlichia japonica]